MNRPPAPHILSSGSRGGSQTMRTDAERSRIVTRPYWFKFLRGFLCPHAHWLLPALIALLIMAGTLGPDSFFMHLDTPTLHQNAADLVLGRCWGPSGKPLITLILAIPYAIGGPDPAWEILVEALLAAVLVAAFARLAARLIGSRRWALLASLYFISLPFVLFFMRMHLVYPLAFFTLGLMFHLEGRFTWAGIAYGLTPLAHAGFLIVLAAWLGFSFLLQRFPVRSYLRMGLSMLIPIAGLEAIRFLFMGEPLAWTLGLFGVVQRHSRFTYPTDWRQVWAILRAGDGWLNALILLGGSAAYPLVRRRGDTHLDALYLATWPALLAFTAWTGVLHREMIPHLLAGFYPLLAVLVVVTASRASEAAANKLRGYRISLSTFHFPLFAVAVSAALIIHALDAAAGSRTAYPEIDALMARAAREGRPVRYFGNFHVGYLYGLTNGVETGINEKDIALITADTQAVLIFENRIGGQHRTLAALRDDPRFDPTAYDETTIPGHFTVWRPYLADLGREGTAKLLALPQAWPPVRWPGAPTGSVSVFWPRQPSGEFHARHEPEEVVYYYPGEGCITPRRFGDQNYYEVLADKAVIVWGEVRAGRVGEALRLIGVWLRE